MPKSKKTKKLDNGLVLTEKYIAEKNLVDAFDLYIKMIENPKKFQAPPEALAAYIQKNIKALKELTFADVTNVSKKTPRQLYLQLYYLSQFNENLTLSNNVKIFLVENVDKIRGSYFDNTKKVKNFNRHDPLIESLTWHSQLNLPKGSLNKTHSALAAFYADARDPKLLTEVTKHLRACSFIELEYLDWIADDVFKTANKFSKKYLNAQKMKLFDLTKTCKNF